MSVRLEPLLSGYRMSSDRGAPAFCGVNLLTAEDTDGTTRRILVDTGHIGVLPVLRDALAAVGLTGADIDTVVLTHGHWDHVANVGDFGAATIVLHERERAYVRAPHPNDFPCPRWVTLLVDDLDERIVEVSDGHELVPGVRVLDAPGHSAGSIAVVADTADGVAVMAGDAIQNAHVARTGHNGLVFWDDAMATRSIARILDVADVVYPGHDQAFRVRADGDTEYVQDLRIRLTGLDPADPGVRFDPTVPPRRRIMPGIEEQPGHPLIHD